MAEVQIGWDVLKWGGGIVAGVLAFFSLRNRITTDIEAKLKLRLELAHAETATLKEENRQLRLEIDRLTIMVEGKLSEKEHSLLCTNMKQEVTNLSKSIQKEVESINSCLTREFKILHDRMDKRRKTNGFSDSK